MKNLRFAWCGIRRWGFGLWRAPRGRFVFEMGPLDIIWCPA